MQKRGEGWTRRGAGGRTTDVTTEHEKRPRGQGSRLGRTAQGSLCLALALALLWPILPYGPRLSLASAGL